MVFVRWRVLQWVTVLAVVAAIWESALAQQVLQLTLQQAAQMGFVQLVSKGGFLGDTVAVDAVNNSAIPVQIKAQIGDVLANKDSSNQALVVTKNLDIVLGPGQSVRLGGLWSMCIQEHKSAPSYGDVFDVAPNLSSWTNYPAAGRLLEYLYDVDAHGRHESRSAQSDVWRITSGPGFPREILTPNAGSPWTSYVVPLDEHGNPIGGGIAEDFEACDLSQSRLPWETGGDASWFVTDDEAHSGHCSARAGRIGHYGDSYLELSTYVDGSVSFWYKVSSEAGCDELCFYVDWHLVDCWSGEIDWSYAEYPLHAGHYVLTWVYSKDSSVSHRADTAWIDDISFGGGSGVPSTCREPNDDFGTACTISLPFSGRFAIDHGYDRDFFRFTLGGYAEVSVEVFAARIGSHLDSYLCLYDASGHAMACNDDYHGSDSFISAHLGPGTYFVEVRPYSGAGTYELRIQARGGH